MDPPKFGGTCWRIYGKDTQRRTIGVGFEAYLDENEEWAVLITVVVRKGTKP